MKSTMVRNARGYLAALALTSAAAVVSVSVPVVAPARGDGGSGSAPGRRADQEALKPFASFVGDWRGAGQVERGRTKGSWTESATWAWKLTNDSAALEITVKRGKHLKSGQLRPGKEPGTFVFDAVLADGSKRTFTGKTPAAKDLLVLKASAEPGSEGIRRITMTPLHETRLLLLLEAEQPDHKTYARIGEVGYTREGVKFAAGDSSPICIVTEGRGTIQVSHKGKTYWVCCSGCRDLFNDDPEAVLAEAAAREKSKAAAKKE
jgi:YHS domain-containing protein